MKVFYTQHGIGRAKYLVNFHNGVKLHQDGSAFYDVKIFTNLKALRTFTAGLLKEGYTQKITL